MNAPDYYKTLGVGESASEEDIKKAFRKLAKKYHPDVRQGDKTSEERFKRISEAYEVLGDKKRRQEYDELRKNPAGAYTGASAAYPGGGTGWPGGFERTAAYTGDEGDFSDFFEMFFGHGRQTGGGEPFSFRSARSRSMPGQDAESDIEITAREGFEGVKKSISLEMNGSRKTIQFGIPPGTADGARIKLKGQGGPGIGDGPAGDLYLRVRVRDPRFELSGLDLTADIRLLPWEAALGAQVPFETLDGSILVRVPEGMQTGRRIRIAGRGYQDRKGRRGDLYARVSIVNPSPLTGEQRKLYEQLQNTTGSHAGR